MAQSNSQTKALICIFLLVSIVLSFKPLPQVFSGVDTTITGIRPESSAYMLIFLASTLPWIGLSFVWASDNRGTGMSVVLNCTPLVLLIISAATSLAWSIDEYATLKTTMLLCIYVLLAATTLSLLGPTQSMGMLFLALLIVCAGSILWVFLEPASGIHHATDYESGHAGRWRGVFGHKNLLGQVAALLAITSVTLTTIPRLLRLIALVVSIVILTNAESGSSTLVAIIGVSSGLLITAAPRYRAGVLLLLFSAIVAAYAAGISVIGELASLLGKDETLTGRTEVWGMAAAEIQRNLPFGLGFGAVEEFNKELYGASGYKFVNVHNSFLEILLSLGLLGLVIIVTTMTSILRWSLTPALAADVSWRTPYVVGLCWLISGLSEVTSFQPNNVYFFAGSLSLLILSELNRAEQPLPAGENL